MTVSLFSEITNYFPDGSLQMFDCIYPLNLPTTVAAIQGYVACISELAKRFSFHSDNTADQFKEFLQSAITHDSEKYCTLRQSGNTINFWVYFLGSNHVTWENDFKSLVLTTLTLPIGSADIERGFSTMNYIRTSRRSRLSKEHIEDIMCINVNGPKLEDFDATSYALAW